MKVVIFCGGKGTRLREETEFKPKPLLNIGEMPILWHIMKHYSYYGFNEFVLCLGYKGDMIKRFFLDYEWLSNDFTIKLKQRNGWQSHIRHTLENWTITLADTGLESMTGKRLKMVEKYIEGDTFMVTYGDGISTVDIKKLLEFHRTKGKLATLTGLHPVSRYGILQSKNGLVHDFKEKPLVKDIINAGYMVFNKKIFKYLDEKDNKMLVHKLLPYLSEKKELAMYKHEGFFYCMDTHRDYLNLNEMWKNNDTPWKIWDD